MLILVSTLDFGIKMCGGGGGDVMHENGLHFAPASNVFPSLLMKLARSPKKAGGGVESFPLTFTIDILLQNICDNT